MPANLPEMWQEARSKGLFAPLVELASEYVATVDPHKRAIIVEDACDWIASVAGGKRNYDVVNRITSLLDSKAGESFLRWCLYQLEAKK